METHLRNNYGINPKVISNLANNRIVTLNTILTLCEILDCQPGDIMEYIPEKGKK
ncbi:MAG: helix-turn-helix transcriptional regulator [Ruminococcaceae bacterium]|nr:helix-turn-helix transcriptional regulator [Oscillospiraceae bacterium]